MKIALGSKVKEKLRQYVRSAREHGNSPCYGTPHSVHFHYEICHIIAISAVYDRDTAITARTVLVRVEYDNRTRVRYEFSARKIRAHDRKSTGSSTAVAVDNGADKGVAATTTTGTDYVTTQLLLLLLFQAADLFYRGSTRSE